MENTHSIYDLDGCLYKNRNISIDFMWYCLKRHPRILRYMLKDSLIIYDMAIKSTLYSLSNLFLPSSRQVPSFNNTFYNYLTYLNDLGIDLNSFVLEFIDEVKGNISQWYEEKQNENDIVISSSADFLVSPFCKNRGIEKTISTKVNTIDGSLIGNVCFGKEKLTRLETEYPDVDISTLDFYFDDPVCDSYLLKKAKKSYIVVGNHYYPYVG